MGLLLWNPIFDPQPKFAMPRSYFSGWSLAWDINSHVLSVGQETVIGAPIGDDYQWHIKFKSQWWNWNSNTYTPDFIMEDFYVHRISDNAFLNVGDVNVIIRTEHGKPGYRIDFRVFSSVLNHEFDFPASPGGYWLDPLPQT